MNIPVNEAKLKTYKLKLASIRAEQLDGTMTIGLADRTLYGSPGDWVLEIDGDIYGFVSDGLFQRLFAQAVD